MAEEVPVALRYYYTIKLVSLVAKKRKGEK